MTGAVAGQGLMGYSELEQVAEGLRQRCYARAFVVVDQSTGNRVAYVNADVACLFDSVHQTVVQRLQGMFDGVYTEANIMLTATHNHNSCGGSSWDFIYTLATNGFRRNTFEAEVAGIIEAIAQAHDRLAPGTITLGREQLHNASANRSRGAFDRNPEPDKAAFPDAIDPMVTVLRFRQGGRDVGAITWFATHGTSLTDRNRYISCDNKGYASYLWEHDTVGVRYLDGPAEFVAAFSQTNAGDMTPNLDLVKMHPTGPTQDNVANNRIIGERQFDAGRSAFDTSSTMSTVGVSTAFTYIDMGNQMIDGRFTPDGKPARTTPAMTGVSTLATSTEDNWNSQLSFLQEGTLNPLVVAFGGVDTPVPQWIRDAQWPKLVALPAGLMPPAPWAPEVIPLQIVRIGDLVIAGGPAEFTIVAGLRIRQVVARELGVPIENVLTQGYTNSYVEYCTTPEEYDAQMYEGGSTMYGRWSLCAYMQTFAGLAAAIRSDTRPARGPAPLDKSGFQPDLLPPVPPDAPQPGTAFGDVTVAPQPTYATGDTVTVEFVGGHPNNDFRRNSTYLEVQQYTAGGWVRIADDNSYETTFHWERPNGSDNQSTVRIIWAVPPSTTAGRYRIEHYGAWRDNSGRIAPYTGTSPEFTIG